MTPYDGSRLDRIEETLGRLVGVVENLALVETRTSEELKSFIASTNAFRADTERRIRLLEESQDDSKDRLDALIKIVDSMIRKPPSTN